MCAENPVLEKQEQKQVCLHSSGTCRIEKMQKNAVRGKKATLHILARSMAITSLKTNLTCVSSGTCLNMLCFSSVFYVGVNGHKLSILFYLSPVQYHQSLNSTPMGEFQF